MQYGCWYPSNFALWWHLHVPCWCKESKYDLLWICFSHPHSCACNFPNLDLFSELYDLFMEFHCEIRLLYEVFPMSYLMEQAGGQAFTGKNTWRITSIPWQLRWHGANERALCGIQRRWLLVLELLAVNWVV